VPEILNQSGTPDEAQVTKEITKPVEEKRGSSVSVPDDRNHATRRKTGIDQPKLLATIFPSMKDGN
jgi:hypothetical protein